MKYLLWIGGYMNYLFKKLKKSQPLGVVTIEGMLEAYGH